MSLSVAFGEGKTEIELPGNTSWYLKKYSLVNAWLGWNADDADDYDLRGFDSCLKIKSF